ncbi:MAG TPA: CDP-diacylglycerol--serine O-phosphatidyltransferase [Cyclobacteriaceae bacterium]
MKNLPHILTLFNLLSGCLGITFLFQGHLSLGAIMIFAGAIFDFLDGFAARMLNAKSELGKQLDSLADLVTFGVLPALILYTLSANLNDGWISYLPLGVAIAAALRLAKFNIDDRQTNFFIGLPTPAAALLVASIPFIMDEEHVTGTLNIYSLIGLSVFLSIMMISRVKLMSFKFSHYNWKENEPKYILILLFLVLVFYFSFISIPLIFLLYLIFSVFVKYPETTKKG